MASVAKAKRPKRPTPRSCLGPVADLEAHLPAEWWRKLFNALYVKTDGDVVENVENTRRDVDFILAAAPVTAHSQILDLCCGQRRHCLDLARRGFKNVTGVDRSRYLIRLHIPDALPGIDGFDGVHASSKYCQAEPSIPTADGV